MKTPKRYKMSISLSAKEKEVLALYAAEQGVTRGVALRRIVKQELKAFLCNHATAPATPANQLDIFDSVQIDIFNNTSKTL